MVLMLCYLGWIDTIRKEGISYMVITTMILTYTWEECLAAHKSKRKVTLLKFLWSKSIEVNFLSGHYSYYRSKCSQQANHSWAWNWNTQRRFILVSQYMIIRRFQTTEPKHLVTKRCMRIKSHNGEVRAEILACQEKPSTFYLQF